MRSFRDLPIRRKLTLIIMLTSSIGLVLAGALFIYYERGSSRELLREDLSALAKVVGDQSTAAIAFKDSETAKQTLAALKSKPEITDAAIYTPDGNVFAHYSRAGTKHNPLPRQLKSDGYAFGATQFELFETIKQKEEVLGTLYLRASLQRIQERLTHYITIVAVVILAISLISLAVTTLVQRSIADPILELASVARVVRDKKDYSVRAPDKGTDEIGEFITTFNQMLGQIEQSHTDLRVANASLKNEIADRQRAEESLAAHSRKLEQSNRELQDFAYVASHDLQEPLRAIQNFSDRLRTKHGATLNEEGQDYLQRMQNAAGRMRVLIQDLLAYSRVTTKVNPFSLTDLESVAKMVVADLEARLEATGGRIEVGELPTLDADPTQMRQLLQNLVGNALKFHPVDVAPVVKVYAVTDAPDGMVRIAVEDNGIGLDEKYCDRIFAPFQRLHGQRKYEGTGIGLAICRKIVERHEGTIAVRSKPGEGATFIVTLPVRQEKREVARENDEELELDEEEVKTGAAV